LIPRQLELALKYYLIACYHDRPVKQSDFPQHFFDVDLKAYEDEIRTYTEFLFSTREIIRYNNVDYPILKISYNEDKAGIRLLVLAGVHGNETGGVLAVPKFLLDIIENPAYYADWAIRIITPVNPVGVVYLSRYNENGCDLNRKFFKSTQKGIEIQTNAIDEFDPHLIISLHEAPSTGFLLHPSSHMPLALTQKILDDIVKNGVRLSQKDYWGRTLKIPGCSQVAGFMKVLSKLIQVQSLDDYVEKRGIPVITTESGWNSPDTFQRIDSHLHLIRSVVKRYQQYSLH